jgi:hypothetical protein
VAAVEHSEGIAVSDIALAFEAAIKAKPPVTIKAKRNLFILPPFLNFCE